MQCMLLIYHDQDVWSKLSDPDRAAIYADYRALAAEMGNAGVMRAGGELTPTPTAITMRVRDGKSASTEGPFAQTNEQLAGFFRIDCSTMDEALGWAAKIPTIEMGAIEVRKVTV